MSGAIPFIGAVAALLTVVVTLIATLRNGRKVEAVHVLVNSRLDAALTELQNQSTRVEQLVALLHREDIAVPTDPAKPSPQGPPA